MHLVSPPCSLLLLHFLPLHLLLFLSLSLFSLFSLFFSFLFKSAFSTYFTSLSCPSHISRLQHRDFFRRTTIQPLLLVHNNLVACIFSVSFLCRGQWSARWSEFLSHLQSGLLGVSFPCLYPPPLARSFSCPLRCPAPSVPGSFRSRPIHLHIHDHDSVDPGTTKLPIYFLCGALVLQCHTSS